MVKVDTFGAFVAMDGFRKNGMVHISQVRVRDMASVHMLLIRHIDNDTSFLRPALPAHIPLN